MAKHQQSNVCWVCWEVLIGNAVRVSGFGVSSRIRLDCGNSEFSTVDATVCTNIPKIYDLDGSAPDL